MGLAGELRPKQRHMGQGVLLEVRMEARAENIPGRGQTECVCIFEKQRLRKCMVGLVRRGWSPWYRWAEAISQGTLWPAEHLDLLLNASVVTCNKWYD